MTMLAIIPAFKRLFFMMRSPLMREWMIGECCGCWVAPIRLSQPVASSNQPVTE